MALTDAQIRRTKATVKTLRLYDGDGMHLVVQPQGGRSWRFDYRFQGTRKGISLGTYPEVSLAVARERRAEARRLVAEGLDPSRVRQAAKRGPADGHTFDAVAAEWLAKQATKWAASTTEKATYHLSLPSPWIGRRPIANIEPPELLDVLRDIESRGHIETAHNVKQRVGQVFRYAIATGRATRDPSADLRGALTPISRKHRAALTAPDDIRTLLRAIAGYHGSRVVHAALQMLPLVFVRPGELRLARWSEFTLDEDSGLWRIPAERMKHREPHLVPLSRQVVRLLKDLQRFTGPHEGERPEDTLVFPSRVGRRIPISENTLNGALRRLGFGSRDMSAHGFRTLASTRLHEMLEHSRHRAPARPPGSEHRPCRLQPGAAPRGAPHDDAGVGRSPGRPRGRRYPSVNRSADMAPGSALSARVDQGMRSAPPMLRARRRCGC